MIVSVGTCFSCKKQYEEDERLYLILGVTFNTDTKVEAVKSRLGKSIGFSMCAECWHGTAGKQYSYKEMKTKE